jgi:hypothetical protein
MKIMEYRSAINTTTQSEGSVLVLDHLDSIKDLGVTFDTKLKFDKHIIEKVNKSYSVLGLIYRNFRNLLPDTFFMLYKTLVRSHIEYANCVWSPYRQMDIKKLEKVQMRATKMVQQLRNLSYEDRLKRLNLPTLKYRRCRGDMIQVYNIVSGKHNSQSSVRLNVSHVSNTRGK